MVVSGIQRADVRLSVVPPADVENVRHFDQLGHSEQHAFLQLYQGSELASVPLDDGEVVVFTDYYRVER